MNREKILIIVAIASVLLYASSLHRNAIHKAYENGYLMGKTSDAWVFSTWTLNHLELLQKTELDSLSKGLDSQLDLLLGDVFLAQTIDSAAYQAIGLDKSVASIRDRNRTVLKRAAVYRSQNEGIFIWPGSDSYKDLMMYLPLDSTRQDNKMPNTRIEHTDTQ